MQIIFVTASMTGGGSERVIAGLSEQFVSMGHEVSVIMTAGSEIAYKLPETVKISIIGERTGGSIKKRFNRIFELRKYFKEQTQALIISFGTETNMFCILANLGRKQKLIISERNDPNKCSYKLLRNIIYSMGKKFVFQTEDALKHFSKRIQKRGIVIPNPLLNSIPAPYTGEREKKVVAAGRLTKQKNHKLLLEAFAEFLNEEKEYQLVLYGQGELQEVLENQAKELHIQDNVVFAGFRSDILECIKSSSMYVLSSDYEGISNSLLEAMALGLPVISTDCPIGGSRMCIQNNVNGILVGLNNSKELATAMKKIASDSAFAKELGVQAAKIRDRFALDKIAKLWLEFGEKV